MRYNKDLQIPGLTATHTLLVARVETVIPHHQLVMSCISWYLWRHAVISAVYNQLYWASRCLIVPLDPPLVASYLTVYKDTDHVLERVINIQFIHADVLIISPFFC